MKRLFLTTSIAIFLFLLIFYFFLPVFRGVLIISPVIDFGIFTIRWYGLILATAILAGFLLARKFAWIFGIAEKEIDDLSFWLVLTGILGARIYYVLFSFSYYLNAPIEIFKVWHGGLSIYGGLIAGFLFLFIYTLRRAYSFYQLSDLIVLVLPISQAIGRLGNFVNYEAFGLPTNLPWKMFVEQSNRPFDYITYSFFHPTFLYEILLNLFIFAFLFFYKNRFKRGVLTFTYLAMYSCGRFFIEAVRLDSSFLFGFKVDQIIALMVFVVSVFMLIKISNSNPKIQDVKQVDFNA